MAARLRKAALLWHGIRRHGAVRVAQALSALSVQPVSLSWRIGYLKRQQARFGIRW